MTPERTRSDPAPAGDETYAAIGFSLLLAAMLAELALAPLATFLPSGLALFRLLTAVVLFCAMWVVGSSRVALILFSAAIVAHVVANLSDAPPVVWATLHLAALVVVASVVVARVMRAGTVTFDTVAGAACAYMLLGLIWGDLYLLVELARPGSFEIPLAFVSGPNRDLRAALTYFSFITLTTVGYGVIHPQDPAAGGLCAAEALIGQLYLAIMIARMVGLHTSRRTG
jgi:voltage-gated potassium channel